MDEKKIIIINLSKGLIGETNANLLGSMLTTRIYLAAMSRADLSPEKMREMSNFYFYVDEFQSFANATFANILSEARKYHLNLTIAHQYIEQMEEEVRNAVFGNVGTIVSFRVGPFDAEVLETIFTPQFTATDIVNLSFAQVYLTLMIDGIGSQPFSATTLPPIAPPTISCKDMAVAASRKAFTRPRKEVEEEILKFHERVASPKAEVKRFQTEVREQIPKKDPNLPERTSEKPKFQNENRREQEKRKEGRPVQEKKTTSAEDLRAILKRIAGNETKSSTPEAKVSKDKASEPKEKTKLKEALHTVLSKETIASKESEPKAKEELAEEAGSAKNNPSEIPPPTRIPSDKEAPRKDPLTPRELERMMRITTNDKPSV
jgi:hypothetical protein